MSNVVKRSHRGQLVAQFSGQSYVKLRSVATAGPRTSISLQMRTSSKDGVILFSSLDSDQNSGNLSLSLVGGHVQFRYHLGEDHLVLQSPYQVTLGSWHNLVLQTYHGDAMFKLDTKEPVLGSLQGGKLAGTCCWRSQSVRNQPGVKRMLERFQDWSSSSKFGLWFGAFVDRGEGGGGVRVKEVQGKWMKRNKIDSRD